VLRGLEALAIALVTAVAVCVMRLELWGAVPQHQVTAERAVAWMLLASDSAPYTGELPELARMAFGEKLAYVRWGSSTYGAASGEVYAVRAVWLGYNGTLSPVEVVIGVRP